MGCSVFLTGNLLCMRCSERTSSPRWRTQTLRTERTHPPQPDTPSCPSTTAGCSTLGDTSLTRTADVYPPYPGDHSMSCHFTKNIHNNEIFVVTPISSTLSTRWRNCMHWPFCLCTDCMRWTFCLFCRHHILLASHSHSPFSHAWSCSCVSRAMFPETEQQAVSKMMARESNYPSAVLSAWWWGFGFLTLSLRRVNTV